MVGSVLLFRSPVLISNISVYSTSTYCPAISRTSSCVMFQKFRMGDVDITPSRRRYTMSQYQESHAATSWRVAENIHFIANNLQKVKFCSQAAPGTKSKVEEPRTKVTLGRDDLTRIKSNFGGQSIKVDEIVEHNKEALSQMDRKIKENIDLLKKDMKKMKESRSSVDSTKNLNSSEENESPYDLSKYLEILRKYLPVKILGMDEMKEILSREFEQFSMSDLQAVPNHVSLLSLAALAPFLVPCADVILLSGYTPGMEFVQTTYSSILLTTLGTVQLSSHLRAIFHNNLDKEAIPSLVAPFSLAWLSLLVPSFGLVLNSTGLVMLFLGDIQRNRQLAPWYRSLRLASTSTAVLTMLVMVTAKMLS